MARLERCMILAVLSFPVFVPALAWGQSFDRVVYPVVNELFPLAAPAAREERQTLDRLHSPVLRNDLAFGSATSCAAASCHGGPQPGVTRLGALRGSEYQIWKERDPHAQSWRTICSAESVQIMQRLRIMQGNDVVDQVAFENCLACHNTDRDTSSHASQSSHNFQREGVGCGTCHGPSERWIGTHYQDGWSSFGAADEGFVEASDLYVRARMCASCHVGDQDRDMNHDIIAAGHPPLRYEFSTYHAKQPKHWRDAEASDVTFYEAQLWLAGQIASADASLSLLQTRALDAHSVSQWPELAAYDCASCHHELGLARIDDGKAHSHVAQGDEKPLGVPSYSEWNDAGLRWLIQYREQIGAATTEDDDLASALKSVRSAMEVPIPDAADVAESAAHARLALAAWFDGPPGVEERTRFRSERLSQVVATAGKSDSFRTWESAVQFYLAAVAARQSWPQRFDGPARQIAHELRIGLRYPENAEIGRYRKNEKGAPTLNREEATKLGRDLARFIQSDDYRRGPPPMDLIESPD